MRRLLKLLILSVFFSVSDASSCRAQEPAQKPGRDKELRDAKQAQLLMRSIALLNEAYDQTGDPQFAVRMREIVAKFARDYPDTPLGRLLRVGPRP